MVAGGVSLNTRKKFSLPNVAFLFVGQRNLCVLLIYDVYFTLHCFMRFSVWSMFSFLVLVSEEKSRSSSWRFSDALGNWKKTRKTRIILIIFAILLSLCVCVCTFSFEETLSHPLGSISWSSFFSPQHYYFSKIEWSKPRLGQTRSIELLGIITRHYITHWFHCFPWFWQCYLVILQPVTKYI